MTGWLVWLAGCEPAKPVERGADEALKKVNPSAGTQHNVPQVHIPITLENDVRVSLAIYDERGRLVRELLRGEFMPAGQHSIAWDGLNANGQPVSAREHHWRLLRSDGLTVRYVGTLGINPPDEPHPQPFEAWVGDHAGAGLLSVDDSGIVIASPATESMRCLVKVDPQGQRVLWRIGQFYDGGTTRAIASDQRRVLLLQPNGKLRVIDAANGQLLQTWNAVIEEQHASDVELHEQQAVLSYPTLGEIHLLDVNSGKILPEAILLPGVDRLTSAKGLLLAHAQGSIHRIELGDNPTTVPTPIVGLQNVTAIDLDHHTGDLFIAYGNRVSRYDTDFKLAATMGKPRVDGAYDPATLSSVNDVAGDGFGGFLIAEPYAAPRRIAWFERDATSPRLEWFGGQSFYVSITSDPDDPASLWGCSPEGALTHYRFDYDTGRWSIVATYNLGNRGDGLFPFTTSYRAVRRNGQMYLYHASVPSLWRVDEQSHQLHPLALAARPVTQGRTFHQFAGTGPQGYPAPLAQAAAHHGFANPSDAPAYFSWADHNGNGEFEPQEFLFFKNSLEPQLHGAGAMDAAGHYHLPTNHNAPFASVMLPAAEWVGPLKDAPVWRWDRSIGRGEITEDQRGFGWIRSLCVDETGRLFAAFHAGLLVREHGQYHGGAWPYQGILAARWLAFDAQGSPLLSAGVHTKSPDLTHQGRFFYPMQLTAGPNDTIFVNDQVHQPATVWTRDGLFVDSLFSRRAEDGLDNRFYRPHSDDMQGVHVVQSRDGRVFWFHPVVGQVLVYEVTGWDTLSRSQAVIVPPENAQPAQRRGEGLFAEYFLPSDPGHALLARNEPVLFHDPHASTNPQLPEPPFTVVWQGQLEAPMTDRYRFDALLGADESITVTLDDQPALELSQHNANRPWRELTAGQRLRIRVEYRNDTGPAELRLFWESLALDRSPLPRELQYP